MVTSRQVRTLPTSPDHIWELLTNLPYELLTSAPYEDNGIFPAEWGGFRAPKGFTPGAPAGHGSYDYQILTVERGRRLLFTSPTSGTVWGFLLEPAGRSTKVTYTFSVPLRGIALLLYPLAWRPLHEARAADILDNLEQAVTCQIQGHSEWSIHVQLLRRVLPHTRSAPCHGAPIPESLFSRFRSSLAAG